MLRSRNLSRFKFRRQYAVGPYIADFCCYEERLLIEVDGSQHQNSKADKIRSKYLSEKGYRIIRFWDHDVLTKTEAVLEAVLNGLKT